MASSYNASSTSPDILFCNNGTRTDASKNSDDPHDNPVGFWLIIGFAVLILVIISVLIWSFTVEEKRRSDLDSSDSDSESGEDIEMQVWSRGQDVRRPVQQLLPVYARVEGRSQRRFSSCIRLIKLLVDAQASMTQDTTLGIMSREMERNKPVPPEEILSRAMVIISVISFAIAIVLLSCRYGQFCICKGRKDGHEGWYAEVAAAKAYLKGIEREEMEYESLSKSLRDEDKGGFRDEFVVTECK
ncbi:hypothetical protein EG329_008102 [Mollisiaceae sp. DMI_Dod_QoI]|nr:hypothetical protein EG329_008102 [Helotiales sp. DMI_Dod_QoI]